MDDERIRVVVSYTMKFLFVVVSMGVRSINDGGEVEEDDEEEEDPDDVEAVDGDEK